MKLFNQNKSKFNILIPKGIQQEWFDDKVRFIGSKSELFSFIEEFRRLTTLNNGDCVKLGKLTLKVSDHLTEDRDKQNWVELPTHAWNIMASKFYDVLEAFENNPFDFNECSYTYKNPFDIGIQCKDLPTNKK